LFYVTGGAAFVKSSANAASSSTSSVAASIIDLETEIAGRALL
jgi:hypothetical protein